MLPGKGAVVTRPTMTDAVENAELLTALEVLAIGLACERASEQQLEEISNLHEEMRLCTRQDNITAYYRLNNALHRAIVAAGGNAALISVHDNVQRHITRLQNLSGGPATITSESFTEHEKFIKALQQRDAEKAAVALKEHLVSTLEKIKKRITSNNGMY